MSGAEVAAGGLAPYGTDIASNYSNPGLINGALDTNAAGQVADIAPTVSQPDLINASTPDSVYQNIFDKAGSDVASAWDQPIGNQYASNLNPTDVPIGSSSTPQNIGAGESSGYGITTKNGDVFDASGNFMGKAPGFEVQTSLPANGDFGVTRNTGGVYDSAGNYIGQAPGFEMAGKNTVVGGAKSVAGPEGSSWLDKIEGIASGIEKYKTTANLGGNLISGAMKYAVPSQSDQAAIELYQAKANLANQEASAIAALEERKRRQNEAVKNLKPVQLNNPMNPIFGNALNGAGIINSARA